MQQGQTLWELSRDYALEPKALATANGIKPETVLQVGQQLTIGPAEVVASQQNAGNTAATAALRAADVNPEQELNLTGSEPLATTAQSPQESTADGTPAKFDRSSEPKRGDRASSTTGRKHLEKTGKPLISTGSIGVDV